jgi:hypothetical protein
MRTAWMASAAQPGQVQPRNLSSTASAQHEYRSACSSSGTRHAACSGAGAGSPPSGSPPLDCTSSANTWRRGEGAARGASGPATQPDEAYEHGCRQVRLGLWPARPAARTCGTVSPCRSSDCRACTARTKHLKAFSDASSSPVMDVPLSCGRTAARLRSATPWSPRGEPRSESGCPGKRGRVHARRRGSACRQRAQGLACKCRLMSWTWLMLGGGGGVCLLGSVKQRLDMSGGPRWKAGLSRHSCLAAARCVCPAAASERMRASSAFTRARAAATFCCRRVSMCCSTVGLRGEPSLLDEAGSRAPGVRQAQSQPLHTAQWGSLHVVRLRGCANHAGGRTGRGWCGGPPCPGPWPPARRRAPAAATPADPR